MMQFIVTNSKADLVITQNKIMNLKTSILWTFYCEFSRYRLGYCLVFRKENNTSDGTRAGNVLYPQQDDDNSQINQITQLNNTHRKSSKSCCDLIKISQRDDVLTLCVLYFDRTRYKWILAHLFSWLEGASLWRSPSRVTPRCDQ